MTEPTDQDRARAREWLREWVGKPRFYPDEVETLAVLLARVREERDREWEKAVRETVERCLREAVGVVDAMYPLCVDEDKPLADDDVAHEWLAWRAKARELLGEDDAERG